MPLLKRLYDFLARPALSPAIAALYRAAVEQARLPVFYQNLAVPDTVDGRFDLVLVHVFLIMRRLGNEGEAKQQLFDLMFADMDRSLREMGVGDMSVGKKIKPMIAAFYGRSQVYDKALNRDDEALAAALGRNLYGTTLPHIEILRLMANYVRRSVALLDGQPLTELLSGRIRFVVPVES